MILTNLRLLVCGGRDYEDTAAVWAALDHLHGTRRIAVLIEGGARGADRLAYQWARERFVPVERYCADWQAFGKSAGFMRNQRMLDDGKPTACVAFPGGRGTADMMRRCRLARVPLWQPLAMAEAAL
jgi:hypothetical protein